MFLRLTSSPPPAPAPGPFVPMTSSTPRTRPVEVDARGVYLARRRPCPGPRSPTTAPPDAPSAQPSPLAARAAARRPTRSEDEASLTTVHDDTGASRGRGER